MIYADGTHHVQTSVTIPKELHTFTKREGISFSAALRRVLEHEREDRERGCNAPTSVLSRQIPPALNSEVSRVITSLPAGGISVAPANREHPRLVTRETIELFEKTNPALKGIGRTMVDMGLWVVDENSGEKASRRAGMPGMYACSDIRERPNANIDGYA
ncbi:hypothetical protein FGW20_08315 [Methanoculleus sp. FWC-SCC3]|uniref:Ribbon-helix-helix protein CopG domain-containing protein n=1 Tax=Methanoculleus methanifontis TaxID=2584086 RepID=A0ABT8M2E8_9EURY|nr:hypothetical protein [Methanoculleus sp. FWC-SCC3]MDN7013042.1 hypothetical protein [Methanoculleus sp. FWC-SCC3]